MNQMSFYSVLVVCVTALVIFFAHTCQRADEIKVELIVECIYANQDVEDPVEKCAGDWVPRLLKRRDSL